MIDKSALLDAFFEVDDKEIYTKIKGLLDNADTNPNWREEFKALLEKDDTPQLLGEVGFNALVVVVGHIKDMEEMERLEAEREARWPTPVYVPEPTEKSSGGKEGVSVRVCQTRSQTRKVALEEPPMVPRRPRSGKEDPDLMYFFDVYLPAHREEYDL